VSTGPKRAPWTEDEVASLNAYQASGRWHPFTSPSGDGSSLIATPAGWVDKEGGPVVQDWAHMWMADWGWKTMASPLIVRG
jgi:hypothetical protein